MSYILQIAALQPPFDIGSDANSRAQLSCNYLCLQYQVTSNILTSISSIITTALSASISSSNILLGTRPVIPPPSSSAISNPSTDGPYVRIIASGGYSTLLGRGGNTASRGERPSIQVIVSSLDGQLASTIADSIFRLLDGKRHTVV